MSEPADQSIASVSLESHLQEHLSLFRSLSELSQPTERAADMVVQALLDGNKLMLCGNGGSAADCQHMVRSLSGRP